MDRHAYIKIFLTVHSAKLELNVTNSVESEIVAERNTKGIGLANLRRQLALLYDNSSLTISHEKKVFSAKLKINLQSYVQN